MLKCRIISVLRTRVQGYLVPVPSETTTHAAARIQAVPLYYGM